MDNNVGVEIIGKMPPNVESFSARGIEIEKEIDFSNCHGLTFLTYGQAGFIFGDTDKLAYVKIGSAEPLRRDKIVEFLRKHKEVQSGTIAAAF